MVKQSQIVRWVTLVLSSAVVTAIGLVVIGVGPVLLNSASSQGVEQEVPSGQRSGPKTPVAMAKQFAPALPLGTTRHEPSQSRSDRYDDIVVDVNLDGTLQVLGEPMEVQTFKSLLNTQLQEQLQTLVTIRPDGNCLFRHVGPVITVCEQAGVPYRTLMQANSMSSSATSPPDIST